MIVGVVAAHPDDEVLGCGGTIARLAAEHRVHVVILGEGISARYDRRGAADRAALERLREDARAVAALLRVESVEFGELPDNRFDEVPLLDVIKRVEQWIGEVQPALVYTHHPGDLNVDHTIAFRATLTATRPVRGCPVQEVYAFEVPSSTEWGFHRIEPVFRPNTFVDISMAIETKVQAMERYGSEARPRPHPRSAEALRAIARRWGSMVGVEYAEAFELVRAIR